MSEKIIIETLHGIGLTEKDAQTYIHIAKKGPIPAREITKSLKITKAQVYRSLKSLQSKGIIEATIETPQKFTALPFEKVFDLYVRIKKDEVQKIEQNREAALQQWQSIASQSIPATQDKFMVIVGKNFIYTKVAEMLKVAKKEALISASSQNLVEADLANSLETFVPNNKIPIKILTEISESNMQYMQEIFKQFSSNVTERHVDLSRKFFPRFVLTDDDELLFVTQGLESSTSQTDAGLWTNNKALILSFRALFDQIWHDAVDIKKRVEQLENGQELPENQIIKDPKIAYEMAKALINNAKKEIILIVTEKDLEFIAARKSILEKLSKKNIDIKLLAPITDKNRKFVAELSKHIEIRHSRASYFRSAIIDGEHLFQLKKTKDPIDSNAVDTLFESTFYTNDPEFVKGRRNLLVDLWQHSPEEIEKLKQNLSRFQSIFENSKDAIVLATKEGKVITANRAAHKMFSMTPTEMEKSNYSELLAIDQNAIEANNAREPSDQSEVELIYRRKDGSTFKGETTASSFDDGDGQTKDCITVRDITEKRQLEDALRENKENLELMFNSIRIGVAVMNANGKIVKGNPALHQIMGYSKEELETKSTFEITHPEDRPLLKQIYQDMLECKDNSVTVEKRNVSKDDSILWVRANIGVLARDEMGKPVGYVATIEDISKDRQNHRSEDEIRAVEERFNTFLKNSPDLVYRLNLQTGHYEFFSSSSKKIIGMEPQELMNMNNEEVLATVHPDDLPQVQSDLMRLVKEGKTVAEYRLKRKDGTYIWYRNTMFLTYDENGRPLYRDGFGRDITEYKKAQIILKTQEKNGEQ